MCGICGFFGGDDRRANVTRMNAALAHRGPDDHGIWLGEKQPIALAHNRLSIVDLSQEGHQPMASRDGRWHLVFNGEIYNHAAIRATLEAGGHAFRSHSDTEVLLTAITAWGPRATLKKIVGMFAFAAWDETNASLTLAVDRLGEKPLYYGWFAGGFGFASELKALCAHPGWHRRLDPVSIAHYLARGYVAAPHCIYHGIAKLEPGKMLELRFADLPAGQVPATESYWRPQDALAAAGGAVNVRDDELVDELESRLREAIRLQMVADVPVGAFLSGGVDSSLIVALMQASSSRPIKTFAVGFGEHNYDESGYARAVAQHIGTDHAEMTITAADALAVLPRLAGIYDEPFADSSQIPVCCLAAFARQQVKVSLSGDAGDELFLGYTTYRHVRNLWRAFGRLPLGTRRQAARLVRRVESLAAYGPTTGGRRRMRLRQLGRVLEAASPQEMHSLLTTSQIEDLVGPALSEPVELRQTVAALSANGDWLTDLSLQDIASYLPGDILVKVDRAAMAVALETRIPMLDHRVVEFALRLPARCKMRNGRGKWILRQLLDRYVPRTLVDRPKMGFGAPIGAWLRGPMRAWAEALLTPTALEKHGIFAPEKVRQLWQEHLAGRVNHSARLWNVLMLQNWLSTVPT